MSKREYEIVVVGGPPGGIAAAVAAGRLGRRVLLVEYHRHLGGMSASGLGKSDVENRELIGGLFREFTERIRRHYRDCWGENSPEFELCRDGFYFEPSVAESVFGEMLEECPSVTVRTNMRIGKAELVGKTLRELEIVDRASGSLEMVKADLFIDASYEGDLFAAAGAEFRLGRESRDEFDEPHAGVIYFV